MAMSSANDDRVTAGAARELARALDAEPLFAMSRGSKELFHSDLLGWFVERFRELGLAAFPANAGEGTVDKVERERLHLDLLIRRRDHQPVVIENKVFSLPDEAQLDRYASESIPNVAPGGANLALLSLADPGWPGRRHTSPCGSVWRWLSYQDLHDRLLPYVPAVTSGDAYVGETLRRYCHLIELLVQLAELVAVRSDDEPVDLAPDVVDALRCARVADSAQKLRAYQIGALLRSALRGRSGVSRVKSNFTHGQPMLEAYVGLANGDDIGWQLQGKQIRLAAVLPSRAGRTPSAREAREEWASGMGRSWFDLSSLERRLPKSTPGTAQGRFNRFDPDFIYCYRNIEGISVRELLDTGVTEVDRAINLAPTLR